MVGDRLGETSHKTFTIPKYMEQNLNLKQCADLIAQHFSSISQEYSPINIELLPNRVKLKIKDENVYKIPYLEAYEVYLKLEFHGRLTPALNSSCPPPKMFSTRV